MVGDHLTESFIFFEESIDLRFVSVFVDFIVAVILFNAVNESEEDVDLFLVFNFAFLGRGQVDFIHGRLLMFCLNIIILIIDSYKVIGKIKVSIKESPY